MIGDYFDKKMGIATGITMAGSGKFNDKNNLFVFYYKFYFISCEHIYRINYI